MRHWHRRLDMLKDQSDEGPQEGEVHSTLTDTMAQVQSGEVASSVHNILPLLYHNSEETCLCAILVVDSGRRRRS